MKLPNYRPRRSCMYVPGANSRAIENVTSLPTDTVIFDLEDAVSTESKEVARQFVCSAMQKRASNEQEIVIRINGIETPWGDEDLKSALSAQPDAILVPKVKSADDVHKYASLMQNHHASPHIRLWLMIEMPEAILNIAEIGNTSQSTRMSAMVMGTNDLAKELFTVLTPDRFAFQTALSMTVMAARANNISVIDGVFNEIGNTDGLRAECKQGQILGFDGKTLIHPSQIEICNEIYSPTESDVENAKAIIDAFALPENSDKGVIKVNGKMTERLHLEKARQLVSTADAISKRNNTRSFISRNRT